MTKPNNQVGNVSQDGELSSIKQASKTSHGKTRMDEDTNVIELETAEVLSQESHIDDVRLSDDTKKLVNELSVYLNEAEIMGIIKDAELLAETAMQKGPNGMKAKERLHNVVKQPAAAAIALSLKIQDLKVALDGSSPELQEALVDMQTELSKTAKSRPKNAVGFFAKVASKLGIEKLDNYMDKKALDNESLKDYINRVGLALDAAEKKIEDVGTLAMTVMNEQQEISQEILKEMIRLKIAHDIITNKQKDLAEQPEYKTESGAMVLATMTNTLTLPIERQVISMSQVVQQNKIAHDNLLTLSGMKDVLKDKVNEVRVVGMNAMSNALTQMGISSSLKSQADFLQKMGEASSELILQSAKTTSELVDQVAKLSSEKVIDPAKIKEANDILINAYQNMVAVKKEHEEQTSAQFKGAYESALKLGEEIKAYEETQKKLQNTIV